MRPGSYLWIALAALFCSLGTYVLNGSMRHPGPYAEVWILVGGALAALGLTSMFFAFKQRAQIKALAQHMGRTPYLRKATRNRKTILHRYNDDEKTTQPAVREECNQESLK